MNRLQPSKSAIESHLGLAYWEGITLGEAFESWVEKYADRPALAYQGCEITYRQMDSFATRIAHQMTELGVKTYDRVILATFQRAGTGLRLLRMHEDRGHSHQLIASAPLVRNQIYRGGKQSPRTRNTCRSGPRLQL